MKRFGVGFVFVIALSFIVASLSAPPGATAAAKTVKPAAAAAAKTVTIGFTASKTGKFNVEATRQINGLHLWMEQVNGAGGIKLADGTVIKVADKFYDDESKKERVQELYTKLINTDKADFLISPYSSGLTDASAVIAQQYNRIMITAGAASDSTYKKGYTLVYQSYTPASRYLTGAVDILLKLAPKAKKIAIIHENDKFATDVVKALKIYAEKKGLNVALFEGYDSGTADFAPFINKIPADVDAIMGGGHFADTTTLARQLYEKKINTKMIALLVAPPEPKFAELGDACISVVGSSQWEPLAHFTKESAAKEGITWFGPTGEEFINAYKAKYKEDPSYHSAGGYVAGMILQDAIMKAGSTDTAKVKAALDAMNIMTFYGQLKFATGPKDHGLQLGHDMVYIQWQKDKQGKAMKQVVWPLAGATASAFVCPAR
ncbi:MAG: amino acid ABC transporter substrate-binding protein [Deltaproteobacteria bacterium]|nr:amino acid ABC transporter substrate-binding protein [Deltaproteobacteria bacterium]